MRIQNNIPGMLSHRYGKELNSKTSKTLEKLSSGCRINRAGDDAAGLSMSEKIRVNLTGYERCIDNVREGVNLANTADAALQEVNDMLCRANELCVAAANGTYTEHEREQLLGELNALYDEMDRIFESSTFNKTQLFRHDDGDFSNGTFEYIETVIETAPDDLQAWGTMDNITTREFNIAEDAKSASVELTLDSDVKSANDLIGKLFEVTAKDGSVYTVRFISGTSTGSTYSSDLSIGVGECATVQDAFNKLCDATKVSTYWQSDHIVLDKENTKVNGSTVTLAFLKEALEESVRLPDGTRIDYEIDQGDGTLSNNVTVSSREDGSLGAIDSGSNDFTASMTVTLYPGKADDYVLTEADKTILKSTWVNMAGAYVYFRSGSATGSYIDVDQLTTAKDLRDAVVAKANGIFASAGKECVITSPASDGSVTITYKNYPSKEWVYDNVSSPSEYIETGTLEGIRVSVTQNAAAETYEVTKITLPSISAKTGDHFTLKIKGNTYHFYDGNKLQAGFTGNGDNIANMTDAQVYEQIRSRVASVYSGDATVQLSGNEIIVTATTINKKLDVSVVSETGSMFTYVPGQVSDIVIAGNHYFEDYSFTWDIADATGNNTDNIIQLAKSGNCVGFRLNGTLYQFVDDPSDAVSTEVYPIDISRCQTYEDVAGELQTAIPGSTVIVEDGKIKVSGTFPNRDYSKLSFEDGAIGQDGLFNEVAGTTSTVLSSGGTKTGEAFALIDFSDYDADNFRELYGKGFQVTCATCEGEYINVIFCYDKTQCSFPESFAKQDEVTGEMRTIHNLVVELKGMSNGSDIVSSIVEQLEPELGHYTGVAVGSPSSVLKVYDKRLGNQYDSESGELRRAEIKSGVLTNCVYTVKENFYAAPDDVLGDIEIDYRNVNIFANADDGEPYITIHLPYLTLKNLKLKPPEPDFSTPEKALQTMERVLQANNAIAYMRGRLGADSNRLEHAYQSLAQAQEQAADAYSRIRDADMADMMTEQTKLSILQQAQQAAQAHTLQMPQQILELLQ